MDIDPEKIPIALNGDEVEVTKEFLPGKKLKGDDWDTLSFYYTLIKRFPLLTSVEEKSLGKQWKEKQDEVAREKLINHNLRLVVSIAKRYVGRGIPLLDLIQEGNIGLITAAERFDYTFGYRFSTYAIHWIRMKIRRSVEDTATIITLPNWIYPHLDSIWKATQGLSLTSSEPTADRIAEKTGLSADRIEELLSFQNTSFTVDLDAPVTGLVDGDGDSFGTLVEDRYAENAHLLMWAEQELAQANAAIKELKDKILGARGVRDTTAYFLRCGLDGPPYEPRTLDDTGEQLGVSRERIRQLQSIIEREITIPGYGMKLAERIQRLQELVFLKREDQRDGN